MSQPARRPQDQGAAEAEAAAADQAAANRGEDAGGGEVQPYNFRRPRLFSQDQMRVLTYVHDAFARDLAVYLSAQLRTVVDISLADVNQALYSEFVMDSPSPSAIYVVDVSNLEHQMLFEIDPRLVVYTIEKLCGGDGAFMEDAREVSSIEQRIMARVMKRAFAELERAWERAGEVSLEISSFETNADFVQIVPGVEPVLVASFETTVHGEASFLNICYPYLLLEKMLGHSDMKQWMSSSTMPIATDERRKYEKTLKSAKVELTAELGRAHLRLSELMDLEVGDIIPLRHRTDDPIQVLIDGEAKFQAEPGKSGQQRALHIVKTLQERDEPAGPDTPTASAPPVQADDPDPSTS